MPKYEFESTRWLRSQAKAHHARKDFDTASTFRTVAEEIETLRETLREAKLQIEYLHVKFQQTGSGNAVLSRIGAALVGEGK